MNRKWHEPKWLRRREGGRGRESEGVVVFNDFRPRGHGARERETNRCGEVFVLIWTRGKVVDLGPCIPAETVKVC